MVFTACEAPYPKNYLTILPPYYKVKQVFQLLFESCKIHRSPTYRLLTYGFTQPIMTDPSTRCYLKDLMIERYSFYQKQTQLGKCKSLTRSIIYLNEMKNICFYNYERVQVVTF